MSIKKLFLGSSGLLVPLLGALYTAGCGGTFTGAPGGAGSGADGGAAGSSVGVGGGGTGGRCFALCPEIVCGPGTVSVTPPGACCSTCEPDGQGGNAGASGGSTGGSAGASGSTSVGGCSGVYACPAIACAAGYTSASQPGSCCPVCIPDGGGGAGGTTNCNGPAAACPAIDCAPGYELAQIAGQCCPSCIPDPNACKLGQENYADLRQKLLQAPSALACKTNNDCTLLSGNAYCGDECSAVPVSVTSAPGIESQLSSYATNNCSTCTPVYPPCAAPLAPVCNNGVCATPIYNGG